jgi:hypothetical protein
MLLIRAALGNLTAANAWIEAHRADAPDAYRHLDSASRRMLPLLHRNVREGIPDEIRRELRAVHHQYWAENQRLFRKLELMLQRLAAAGIPTLVLKGAALSVMHYKDMAVRPMSDFDILVPEEFGPTLVRQFLQEGWAPDCVVTDAPFTEYFYRFRHALDLTSPSDGVLDLHWHVLLEATYRGADCHFWEGSVPMQIKSVATRALNPTDQLLHACLHGYPYNPMPSIRWIVDALTILRTSQIDWERMHRVASDLRVTIPCAEALAFLHEAFDADVPVAAIARLTRKPVAPAEKRYFQRMANPGGRRWWETLEDIWTTHERAGRDVPFWRRVLWLPRHVQFEQQVASLGGLVPHAFVFLKRRFK